MPSVCGFSATCEPASAASASPADAIWACSDFVPLA